MGVKQFKNLHLNREKSSNQILKLKIEKIIIVSSIFIILTMLFLFPKYKVYCENEEIVIEKNKIENNFKGEMKKEDYLIEIQKIQKELRELQQNIPEKIDTVAVYQSIMEFANETDIDLKSVNFKIVERDDSENEEFFIATELENEEKIIIGPDERQLVYLTIEVIGIGSLENCISFLEILNTAQPLIYVEDLGIKGESSEFKTIALSLISYAMVDEQSLEKLE
jgi:cell division protein FtsL